MFSLSDRRDPGDDLPPGGIFCEIEIHHFSGLVAVDHNHVLEQEIHWHTGPAKGLDGVL